MFSSKGFFRISVDGNVSVVTLNSAKVHGELAGAPGALLTPGNRKKMIVGCGKGALELLEVTPAGRKSMPVAAFLNGIRGENIEFLPGISPENKTP